MYRVSQKSLYTCRRMCRETAYIFHAEVTTSVGNGYYSPNEAVFTFYGVGVWLLLAHPVIKKNQGMQT
jgi:hypothetical protein